MLFSAELYEKNPQIKVSRFEEGIFSYADGEYLAKKDKIVNPIRKILGKKTLLECQKISIVFIRNCTRDI